MIKPYEHISWSQMLAWERGADNFYRTYILGEKFENREMIFGKKIAEGLEGKIYCEEADFCKTYLPKPKYKEHLIKMNIDGVPILIIMDGFTENPLIIDEYKTGRKPWTQKDVDRHGQLTLYSMVVWKKYGEIPQQRLFWIPTEINDYGEVCLTGEIPYEFKTERKLTDYAKMFKRIQKAYKEINQFYEKL